jgi:hypothetical protein
VRFQVKYTFKEVFVPQNKSKYSGSYPIVAKSSWEYKSFVYLDREPRVLTWTVESVILPYFSPVDGRMHRYYVDLSFSIKNSNGAVEKYLVEIKPHAQLSKPVRGRKKQSTFLTEAKTWIVNMSKWKAASEWAKAHGFVFKLWTDRGFVDLDL